MCVDEYVNPALSRFGLGCTVLTGFGTRYQITSREVSKFIIVAVHSRDGLRLQNMSLPVLLMLLPRIKLARTGFE
jgi:hypothetical protein